MLNVCIDSVQDRFFQNTLSSLEVLQLYFWYTQSVEWSTDQRNVVM